MSQNPPQLRNVGFLVKKTTGLYPRLTVDGSGRKVVSGAGGVLLTRTATTVGLDAALSAGLARWRRPFARHDPGKIVLDLALSLAIGGGRPAATPPPPARPPGVRA